MSKEKGMKEFELPSGKTAVIKEGKGLHARQAIKMCDGDMSLYLPALMAQLITVDGNALVMEDLDEMPMQDYMKLQAEFADQNFTLPQGT